MGLFSKLKGIVGSVLPMVSSLIPGVGGIVAGVAGQALNRPKGGGAPVTTAGPAAGGMVQTLPMLQERGERPGQQVTPAPGGLMRSIGQGLGQLGGGMVQGISQQMGLPGVGGRGATRMKVGKLTGNFIPAGYVEKMSPSGVIYLAKQRRRRGISARDLSSFYRVNRLVSKIHGRAHRARGRGK